MSKSNPLMEATFPLEAIRRSARIALPIYASFNPAPRSASNFCAFGVNS